MMVMGPAEEARDTLELGADTYISRPPSDVELAAKVRSLLRRKKRYDPPGDNPKLEIESHLSKGEDGSNRPTGTEFRLTSCLMLNKGRLLDYPRLISEVWGGKEVSLDTLHFYMRRLRQKLANVSISELRGVGYCFKGLAGK